MEDRITPASVELASLVHPSLISDTPSSFSTVLQSTSADGRFVVFSSNAPNVVPGLVDAGGGAQLYLRDRATETTRLVSGVNGSATLAGNQATNAAAISADGRFIAFESLATNLVPGQVDTNANFDVFVFDRLTGTTRLVSGVNGSTTTTGNFGSFGPVLSGNGQFIAFVSSANNLIAGGTDGNSATDVFLFDRLAGTTQLVSHTALSATTTSDFGATGPSISADGRFVAFAGAGTTYVAGQVDGNTSFDVFVFDRTTGTNRLASGASGSPTATSSGSSTGAVISADGNFVAFFSSGNNLVTGQIDTNAGNDVFLFDRGAGTTVLVSHEAGSATIAGNGIAFAGLAISRNGQFIAHTNLSANLVASQIDANGAIDAFVFDRVTGNNQLVSAAAGTTTTTSNEQSRVTSISADGRFIAILSEGTNLVIGQSDTADTSDAFLFDRVAGSTQMVSAMAGSTTTTANRITVDAQLSADGQFVLFQTAATDVVNGVVDVNRLADIYAFDRLAVTNRLVTYREPTLPGLTAGVSPSIEPAMSADGRYVAFASTGINLVSGQVDTANTNDIFVYDRLLRTTRLVSGVSGSTTTTGNGGSIRFAISADGRYVAFISQSTNLVAGQSDTNGLADLFVFDRVTGATRLVSGIDGSTTTTANGGIDDLAISDDGRFIAFQSSSTNQISGVTDANGTNSDIFLFDRVGGTTQLLSAAAGSPLTTSSGASTDPAISADGNFIGFSSTSNNLVAGQSDPLGEEDIFLFDRVQGTLRLVSGQAGSPTIVANDASFRSSLSADGRYVLYTSLAINLVSGQIDINGSTDIFVYDRLLGATRLVSAQAGATVITGNLFSRSPVMSGDGRYIAFESLATDLVPGQSDTNSAEDVFLFDQATGTKRLVSGVNGSTTVTANDISLHPLISVDGRFVTFESEATSVSAGLVSVPNRRNAFAFDRVTGNTRLVSGVNASATAAGNNSSASTAISADGTVIAYLSNATNIVGNDFDRDTDLFLFSNNTPFGTITDDTPEFRWAAIPGAAMYRLRVVDNITKQVVLLVNVAGTSYTPADARGLIPGRSYTWSVGAVGLTEPAVAPAPTPGPSTWFGQPAPTQVQSPTGVTYGAGQQFTVAPLTAPVQVSPAGAIAASAGFDKVAFTWNAVVGAHHYSLRVLDTTTNVVVVNVPIIAGTSFTATGGLTPGHSFKWFVGAVSSNGLKTVSNPAGVGFSLAPLTAPTQTGPSGAIAAAEGYDRPTFSWSAVAGADHYSLSVVNTTTGIAVIKIPFITTTSFTPKLTQALTPGRTFQWFVSAISTNGIAKSFNAAGLKFSLAALASPVQNGPSGTLAAATGFDRPTFSWGAVAGAHHYSLRVVDTTTQKVVINEPNLVGTTYATPSSQALTPGHGFKWFVSAISTNGVAKSSNPAGVSFSLAALAKPVQIAPSGLTGDTTPTFVWNAVAGADHYHLRVVDETTGVVVVINLPNLSGTSFTPVTPLTVGHKYRWFVGAVSTNNQVDTFLPLGKAFNII
jgi:hypothetical protein